MKVKSGRVLDIARQQSRKPWPFVPSTYTPIQQQSMGKFPM